MTSALIVAHGQPGDPGPQQQAVEALAASVAAHMPQAQVRGATLAMPGALDIARDDTLIYPMFMASGWFTRSELPRRLALAGAANARILPPFGADPGLPALCHALIAKAAHQQGWPLAETHLLIAAHGSGRSRAPAQAAQAMAQSLATHVAAASCGFIEESPYITEAARNLPARSICLPLFATRAEHVTDDLPAALKKAAFQGITLPPVGLAATVPEMIANSIKAALSERP
ncbi:Sirohydrochlorin ferrochelatase [Paracoccus halophilus]|uniref:Cobalamin biosynthesis protein CbiX n=1 Tax=Paracoccus halophilus TaxID=376733 RepID=A0A099F596_9RHOB|nr:CbiX/SirB N-terminal domain-containing protein [Paracoccus halophilus]KGJ05584.1 cobalamin biosynthesis protein CbiX [Paracoccus halophilus]SFA47174.1 Sirohydrochlorin ferrochelatase [Paracoccus halophilus]